VTFRTGSPPTARLRSTWPTQGRPRLRLTLTKEGFRAIEFLYAEGKVVQTLTRKQRAAESHG